MARKSNKFHSKATRESKEPEEHDYSMDTGIVEREKYFAENLGFNNT